MVRNKTPLAGLTGLRGIAAIWVVLFHLQAVLPDLGAVRLVKYGWVGVDLFFLLSGFILMHAHGRDFTRLSVRDMARFLRLRALRVYPLATVVLLLILALTIAQPEFVAWYRDGHSQQDFGLAAFIKTLLLATRWISIKGDWNQPVWSLSVELLAYCAFPFLAWMLLKLRSSWLLAGVAVASMAFPNAVFFMLGVEAENNIGMLSVLRVAGFFASGVALYRLYPRDWRAGDAGANAVFIAGVATLAVAVSLDAPWMSVPGFALIIVSTAVGGGLSALLLGNRISLFLGAVSFPIYLVHMIPIVYLAYQADRGSWPGELTVVATGLTLAGIMLLSWLLHLGIERPSHQWAKQTFPMHGSVGRASSAFT